MGPSSFNGQYLIMTEIVASNTIQYSSDGEASTSSLTYVKLKELAISDDYTGSWRIVFDLQGYEVEESTFGYGRIYKNGVAYGTEQSTIGSGYVTKSQDFTNININNGDLIQLYVHGDPGYITPGYVRNFRIEFDLLTIVNKGAFFLMF